MENCLKGVVRVIKGAQQLSRDHKYKALLLTCMDHSHSFSETVTGDILIAKNHGNFVPHARLLNTSGTYSETATLELAVVKNEVEHVIVWGHSDCKAMHSLLNTRERFRYGSHCTSWVQRQGNPSFMKLQQLGQSAPPWMKSQFTPKDINGIKLTFSENTSGRFEAIIDEGNNLNMVDKLSQINVLQQLVNLQSYDFIHERVMNRNLSLHAVWMRLDDSQVFVFSQEARKFVLVSEENLKSQISLLKDIKEKHAEEENKDDEFADFHQNLKLGVI